MKGKLRPLIIKNWREAIRDGTFFDQVAEFHESFKTPAKAVRMSCHCDRPTPSDLVRRKNRADCWRIIHPDRPQD